MWLFSCSILRYVHQRVANFVCLLFGAGQIAYSGSFFTEKSFLLQLETMLVRAANQNSKAKPKQRANRC